MFLYLQSILITHASTCLDTTDDLLRVKSRVFYDWLTHNNNNQFQRFLLTIDTVSRSSCIRIPVVTSSTLITRNSTIRIRSCCGYIKFVTASCVEQGLVVTCCNPKCITIIIVCMELSIIRRLTETQRSVVYPYCQKECYWFSHSGYLMLLQSNIFSRGI